MTATAQDALVGSTAEDAVSEERARMVWHEAGHAVVARLVMEGALAVAVSIRDRTGEQVLAKKER